MLTLQAREPEAAPRLLLGVSLLLWGGITGRPLIGLLAAVVTEAAHWTRTRWEFGNPAYLRAWQTSIILLLLTIGAIWLDSSAISAMPRTMSWLPAILFPLQFVQSYGMRRSMSLANLSLYLRKRREHAQQHGLPFRDIRFSFDHVYFVAILISAGLGQYARSAIFFPAVAILVAWAFLPRLLRHSKRIPVAAGVMLSTAVLGGFIGEKVLDLAYHHFVLGNYRYASLLDARQTRTAIGQLEEIKLSSAIRWRLIPQQGELPKLIRIAAYNSYIRTYWSAKWPQIDQQTGDDQSDFETLDSVGIENPYWITAKTADPDAATHSALPRFRIRGATPEKDLLPIPQNCGSIVLPNQDIEINPFGALRVDPRHPVADAVVLWGDPMSTMVPPLAQNDEEEEEGEEGRPSHDLRIPINDAAAITRCVNELGLRDGTLNEKIQILRAHFMRDFTYTRYLAKTRPYNSAERDAFVTHFLEESKAGHCEYFATATAFLLRECGVPTRYATGFAVAERDPESGEALIRGMHAHAWCLAWDASRNKWIDVDLTPPDWTGLETPRMPAWQGLLDKWQMIRDDILVWRSQPGNLAIAIGLLALPLLAGAALIARRLWRSKRRVGPARDRRAERAALALSPLGLLEKPATRHLGPRPLGTPLTRWLLGLRGALPGGDALDQAIALHHRLRFDPHSDGDSLRTQLEQLATQLRRDITSLQPKS